MASVWVGHWGNGGERVYHEDSDCRFVSDRHNEWRKETAEAWEMQPCKYCSPEVEPDREHYDRSLNQKLKAMGREYEQTGKDPLQQS